MTVPYCPAINLTSKKLSTEIKTKPLLLIVDDEKPTRDGLRAALEGHYEVWVADSVTRCQLGVKLGVSPHY
jgi:hypothetical protein